MTEGIVHGPDLIIVAAMAENRVIGREGGMPWHLPADLKHFKAVTMQHPIVMGRRTYESIGRALPGRTNIVITHRRDYTAPGCRIAGSLDEALTGLEGEVMIIGGGEIYRQALPRTSRIHLTLIHTRVDGDTTFPELGPEWVEVEREERPADERNPYALSFLRLERR